MTAIDQLIEELELDPEARSTQRAVHQLENERECVVRALTECQSMITSLLEKMEDDDEWLSTAQRAARTLGYTGVGTRWSEAEARMAKIAAAIEVLG